MPSWCGTGDTSEVREWPQTGRLRRLSQGERFWNRGRSRAVNRLSPPSAGPLQGAESGRRETRVIHRLFVALGLLATVFHFLPAWGGL